MSVSGKGSTKLSQGSDKLTTWNAISEGGVRVQICRRGGGGVVPRWTIQALHSLLIHWLWGFYVFKWTSTCAILSTEMKPGVMRIAKSCNILKSTKVHFAKMNGPPTTSHPHLPPSTHCPFHTLALLMLLSHHCIVSHFLVLISKSDVIL